MVDSFSSEGDLREKRFRAENGGGEDVSWMESEETVVVVRERRRRGTSPSPLYPEEHCNEGDDTLLESLPVRDGRHREPGVRPKRKKHTIFVSPKSGVIRHARTLTVACLSDPSLEKRSQSTTNITQPIQRGEPKTLEASNGMAKSLRVLDLCWLVTSAARRLVLDVV